MNTYVSPKPEELAQKIHDAVRAHYDPIINNLGDEIDHSQQQIQIYTSSLDSLRAQKDDVSSKLAELNNQLASIATKRSSYESRLETARRRAADKRSQVEFATNREHSAESSVTYAQRELESLREPVDDGRYQHDLAQWKSDSDQIDARIDEIKTKLATARREENELSRKIANFSGDDVAERRILEREKRQLQSDSNRYERDIDQLKNKKALLSKPVDDGHYQRELDQYKAEKARREADLNSAETDLSSARKDLSDAKSELHSAESDVDTLLDEPNQLDALERRLPGEISDVEDSLDNINNQISEHQKQIGLWQQELAGQTSTKRKTQAQQTADARAKADRFLQSSHGQTVLAWHRITANMAANRQVWESCIQKVASAEDQMWNNRVLPKYAQAHSALTAEKKVNEAHRTQAHSVLDAHNKQVSDIVQSYLQQDKRNRWALHDEATANNDVFESGQELTRVLGYLNSFGTDPNWKNQTLIAVRTKPMVAFWVLLVAAVGFFSMSAAGADLGGLADIFFGLSALGAIGTLVNRAMTKSKGTNVEWAEQQPDWSGIAQSLLNANNDVARYEQKAQQITAQSRKIIADNRREVDQIRAKTTVADVAPHIDHLVPGFCIFPSEDKNKIDQFCAAITKGYITRGESEEQLSLSIDAFPIPPKVPYSGNDEFANKAIALFEKNKVS